MAATDFIDDAQPIAILVEHRPEIVLLNDKKRDQLFAHIEQEVEAFVPDMTTARGRDECRALAAKVTRTKTAVNKARLQLTEDARSKIKAVNESGGIITEKLEALAEKARAPLTEWEEAEEKREAECKAALERLRAAAVVPMGVTSDGIRARIAEVLAEPLAEDHWQGMLELAQKARETALAALNAALARVEQEEADRAELAALRAAAVAKAEQEEREREERECAEQEAKRSQAAKEREAEDEANREAERERQEQAAADAAERTRLAAEQAATAAAETARTEEAARAEQQAAEQRAAHEAELQAANERAAEIERAAAAEREEREAADQRRAAEEQAAAAERARLEADADRRRAAKREAKEAIMTVDGITETQAKAIVLLIISGEVPRTFLDFAAEPKVRPASPVPGVGQGAGDEGEKLL